MKKKYLISGGIVSIILLFVFALKGIFPFGHDFISWGDMHAQILALYYNFYDVVYNGKSIFIDFTSGTVSNVFANFSYYIFSPFTFIILLFKRADIPQAVGLIVMLKMVISGITCNYFLDKHFKKINNFYKIFFSVLYALSTYNLSLYIITGWIDIVYMFPIMLSGLIDLMNNKKIKLFVVSLILSLIFNFYIALMCILFIFFVSWIYLYFYKKGKLKEIITLLGVSVIVSLLSSSVVLLPIFLQILSSARMGLNFTEIMNSKTGPLIDKFMFLTSVSAMLACILLIIRKFKEHKKFFKVFIPSVLLVGIPLIIEPINKMLHFGSYVFYPYRYGFILIMLLIIGACYSIENYENKKNTSKVRNIIAIMTCLFANCFIILVTYKYYNIFQQSVNKLSFSFNHKAFFLIIFVTLINFISYFVIFKLCNKNNKFTYVLLSLCLITFTTSQAMIYIKIDCDEKKHHEVYDNLNYIYNMTFEEGYHVKKNEAILFENYGFVSNTPSQDFFTSLTDNNMFNNYQYLGYDSNWMNTSSSGSNLFIDGLLSNKYVISEKQLSNNMYEKLDKINSLFVYKTKLPISKGYVIKNNVNLSENKSSFDYSNIIYNAITENDNKIFEIDNNFEMNNLEYKNGYLLTKDKNKESFLEKKIDIDGKKAVYFEILLSHLNQEKVKYYSTFDIYVNGNYVNSYPSKNSSGSIYLGMYENEKLNLKLVLKKQAKIDIKNMRVGLLNYDEVSKFFENNFYDINIKYNSNSINIKYDSSNEDILFVPIPYINGMYVEKNNKPVDVVKVFDSFIGVKLNKGINNIVIKYTTPGLKIGLICSLVGILFTAIVIKFSDKITKFKILNKISYIAYIILYFIMSLIFYIVPLFIFVISFL